MSTTPARRDILDVLVHVKRGLDADEADQLQDLSLNDSSIFALEVLSLADDGRLELPERLVVSLRRLVTEQGSV